MGQESKCEADIKSLVQKKYGIKFPLFSKIEVNGEDCHEVYKFLRTNSSLYDSSTKQVKQIPWNFTKFIVDKKGKVQGFYPPDLEPLKLTSILDSII